MKIIYLLTAVMALVPLRGNCQRPAQETPVEVIDTLSGQFATKQQDLSWMDEKVVVGKDTVSIIIPQRNFGRYDRGLYNFLFIPKGQWALGLTASYGSFDAKDVQMLSVIKDFDFKGTVYSVKPSVAYFWKNNQSVGIKFNYTHSDLNMPNLSVDFDDDLNFSIRDVSYYSDTYAVALYYRNYVGLGREKRFAIFNDVDLSFGGGVSRFKRYYNDELRNTQTDIFEAALNFSPGVCIFVMDYVSFNVSFGVFGIKMRSEKQRTNEVEEGSRFTSGANFKFNIFNINFGIGIHI